MRKLSISSVIDRFVSSLAFKINLLLFMRNKTIESNQGGNNGQSKVQINRGWKQNWRSSTIDPSKRLMHFYWETFKFCFRRNVDAPKNNKPQLFCKHRCVITPNYQFPCVGAEKKVVPLMAINLFFSLYYGPRWLGLMTWLTRTN